MTVARIPFLSLALALAGALPPAQAQRAGEVRLPGGVMPLGTAVAVNPADTLAQNLRILAANPRDVQALTQAGLSAIEVGDPNAALGFLGRAEQLSPSNGYVKAALGSALVNLERGAEAMAFFRQAMSLGVPEAQFVKDRGLAYDLAGDPRQAQRDYLLALRNGPDAETTRRLALSYGITGDRDQALKLLEPLVQRQDQAAWRARAFVLAMAGDQRGAERIVQQVMPVGMGSTMTSFMRQLPGLNASARAHAVNFGTIPTTSPIFAAAVPLEPLRPISGAMTDSLTREEAPVAALAMESNEGRRKNSKAKRRRPGRDDDLLAATPPAAASSTVASAPAASLGGSRLASLDNDRRPPVRIETDARLRSTSGTAVTKAQEAAPTRGETLADATARIAAVRDEALKGAGKSQSAVFEIPATAAVTPPPAPVQAPAPVRVQAPIVASVGAPLLPPVIKTPEPTPAPVRVAVAPPVPQIIAPQIALPPPVPAPGPTVTLAPSEPVKAVPSMPAPVVTAPVPQAGFSAAVMGDVAPPPAAAPTPSPAPSPAQAAPPTNSVQPSPPPAAITTPAPLPSQQAGLVSTGPRPLMGPPAPEGLGTSAPVPTPITSEPIAEPVSTIVAQAPVEAEVVPQGTAPSEDVGLNGLLDDLAPEQERAAGAVLGDAEFRKARAAAKRKADAEAKVKAAEDAELAKKKEEEEAKKRELAKSPPRIWVQVATGSAKSGLGLTMRKVREQAGDTLNRYGSATVPYKATNRLLVGPFASEAEARKAVNALGKKGVQATTFTSAAGQDVAKLASK